jgi:tetratricopeptide (TPR) repeat protein
MGPEPPSAELIRARALVAADPATFPEWPTAPEDAVALGWALKDACYESWTSAPACAGRCADLLASLADSREAPPLRALAAWTRGIAGLGSGSMEDALAALNAAAAAFEALDDAHNAARTQVPKLIALSVLGRHDEALACAQATLAQFVANGDERAAGKVELNLGTMLFRQDRHAEASRHYRRAALRFARVQDVEHSIMADIGLANALTWQFDFDEALRINERARMRADTRGLTVLSAQARGAIGQLELNRGQPQRALPELAAACRLLEQAGGLPQQLAEAEISLADAYLAVNLLPEALALYDRIVGRCIGHDIPGELARALLQRAQARARLGIADLAQADLAEARQRFEAQENPASAALATLRQSALQLQRGDAVAALGGARAAGAVFESAGMPGWHCEADVLAAEACAAGGDADGARRRFEAALRAPGAAAQTDWRCRLGLAALERAAGRRDAAQAQLEQALAAIEAQRAALPGDEFRTAFGADKAAAYDQLVAMALEALDAEPASHVAAETLWSAMERARGRALVQGLGRADTDPQVETLRTRLTWLREQAAQALAAGDAAALGSRVAQARTLEQALLEAHRLAQLASPTGSAVAPTGPPPTLRTLQAELGDGQAWVQYHLLSPAQGERWIAAVVTRERVSWCRGSAAGLAQRLESLRFQLDAMRGDPEALRVHAAQLAGRTRRHLQALHEQFWAPLRAALGERERVIVVPHGGLHHVPFAALHDGAQWLVERHELSLAPGAQVWRAVQRRPEARHERLLAIGVGAPGLPEVEAEAQAIAPHFPTGATVLLGAAATRAALRDRASGADVLHLACHGEFRSDSPYFSALQLADGEFTLRDAAALQLDASLVTLSACETGLSRVAPGDEPVGLVRGFLLAGVPSVVATLWTVDDASTALLMRDFYARLGGGARPGAALRAAQCRLAVAGRHPFHWAAFGLHGRA